MPKNNLYWTYNLPLQVWPGKSKEDPVRIVNYSPRKQECQDVLLSDVIGDQSREAFFEHAAQVLENLARQMRLAAKDPSITVYYPDKDMPT